MSGAAAAAGAFVQIVGGLSAANKYSYARSLSSSAFRTRRKMRNLQALQRRRAFLRQTREALANEMTMASAFEGGFESSRFQGNTASLKTQSAFALDEEQRLRTMNERALKLDREAQRQKEKGDTIGNISRQIGSGLMSMGRE